MYPVNNHSEMQCKEVAASLLKELVKEVVGTRVCWSARGPQLACFQADFGARNVLPEICLRGPS